MPSRVTGCELPELFASSFNGNAEPFFRIQKQVGQVGVDFSPGGNERVARRWLSAETLARPLFPRGDRFPGIRGKALG